MIAIIPARVGSRGIPEKNFTLLAGEAPWSRAVKVAQALGIRPVVTSDAVKYTQTACVVADGDWLYAPAPLHTDDCAMIDVVKDVLARIDGPDDEIIVLLQPTQPLRLPSDVLKAIFMLEDDPNLDAAFSVVQVPAMYHADVQIGERHRPTFPARRQDLPPTVVRDGTVYAFRRSTVTNFGTIYGQTARFFAVDPEYTCSLDTPADWAEAERRLRARMVVAPHSPVASR